jgi:DNA modification methylase
MVSKHQESYKRNDNNNIVSDFFDADEFYCPCCHRPLVVKHSGAKAKQRDLQVSACSNPLLWFSKGKGPRRESYIDDLIEEAPPEKTLHPWAQSPAEAEYVIKNLTVEGAFVLEPFMGSGTTGVAALWSNRQFIGCEIEPQRFDIAQATLQLAARRGEAK